MEGATRAQGATRARGARPVALLLLAFLWTAETAAGQKTIALRDCEAGEFLDTSNFQCTACTSPPNQRLDGEGMEARVPGIHALIQPDRSRTYTVASGCSCAPGWVKNSEDLLTNAPCTLPLAVNNLWCEAFRCNECVAASSLDRMTCMGCGGDGIRYDGATGTCVCTDPTHVLRERGPNGAKLSSKVCEPCPAGSVLRRLRLLTEDPAAEVTEADSYVCEPCAHPGMVVHEGRCVCSVPGTNNPEWTQVGVRGVGNGETCVLTIESQVTNLPRYAEVRYTHVSTVEQATQESLRSNSVLDAFGADTVARTASAPRNYLRRALQLQEEANNGYTSYVVRNSIIFEHYFPLAGTKCRYLRDSEGLAACQALANLCVLQQYDEDTPACSLLSEIHRQRGQWTDSSWDWRLMTPWLRYDQTSQAVLNDLGIEMEFSFKMDDKPGTYDFLQFALARFALNGTFLGWTHVTTEFEFCQPTANQVPRWRRFAYGHARTYECNLHNILEYFPEPVFYDLYLIDYANEGRLFPVPVRNRNLRSRGRFVNENSSPQLQADDLLTRRFMLYDDVSSKTSAGGRAQVVRFAKSIKLTTTVQDLAPNKIYPPVLEILYEERLVSSFFERGTDELGNPASEATNVRVSFTVEYTEQYENFWRSTAAFFGICFTLAGLMALLRLYNWSRRNSRLAGDAPVDFVFLMRGISYCLSTFASVFFWFLFAYSAYFFVFFKMQDNVHLLLPTYRPEFGSENDYYAFYITLQVCFFGQTARMLEIVHMQTGCDIFFLDWEKPRGRVTSKRGDGTKTKFAPVSVWRTIFMANEWNEMQRYRKYDVTLALLLLSAILIAADVQYAATPTPNYRDLTPGPLNIVLRFFNTAFWFLLVAYGEIAWRWLIQDRYFTEPCTHSFVDLCTMAKISVFVLDEKYHGYYLHCRSQHEYADGSMLEMSRQLRQEEEGLTTDRGLPGCQDRRLQTFEIYVSGEWKRQYNHIYRTMMNEEFQRGGGLVASMFTKGGAKPAAEKVVRASKKLNAFLRSFVDQDTSEFPIQHREQTFLHRFLHTPPEMVGTKESIFYPDTFYDYDKVLFYGETWNLILFNLLCVTTIDFWTNNTMLAIFLAYLLDRAFSTLREMAGNRNLSAKTLVDDRFLI